jgi:hypothetical protein
MKYSEFKTQLSDLFEKFEEENGCIISEVDYKICIYNANTDRKDVSQRSFNIKIL